MTSDDFFAGKDLSVELGHRRVDLAFIDGMHQFEFAMRDFAHLERHCSSESVILIHDCYPVDAESAGREPRSSRWSGDVWLHRTVEEIRPDLKIQTIATAPTGLAVIQNLDPASLPFCWITKRACTRSLSRSITTTCTTINLTSSICSPTNLALD